MTTKINYNQIKGAPVSILDYIPQTYWAAILAGAATAALDAYIQPVLDTEPYIYFPRGTYSVNNLTTSMASQSIEFDVGCYILGVATVATDSIFRFRKIQGRYYNLQINGNFNLNYTSAIRIDAISNVGSNYPGRCRWTNLVVANTKIGVLIGINTGASIDAPVSENQIIGGEFRNVERCFFVNQTNGFMYVTGMVIDANNYTSTWDSTIAAAVEIAVGWVQFTNCTFVKADSALGSLLINTGGVLVLTGCHAEAACVNFTSTGTNSKVFIDGYRNNYVSGDVPIATFSGTGQFEATNFFYARDPSKASAAIPLVYSGVGANWDINFVNGYFENQLITALLSGIYPRSTLCNVRFTNCFTKDGAIGEARLGNEASEISKGLTFLPTSGAVLPAAYFTTSISGTILQLTDPSTTFDQCIEMIAGAGAQHFDTNGSAGLIPYSGQSMVLEWYQKAVVGAYGFSASISAIYINAAGDVTSLSINSTAVDGYVGNIVAGNVAATAWTRNQVIIPAYYPKTVQLSVRFTQALTSQTWRIAGIRIF